jgi:hypothetical protein
MHARRIGARILYRIPMTRILLIAILSLSATLSGQAPPDAVIVFYRLPPVEVPKAVQPAEPGGVDRVVRGIRRIFDKNEPVDPDQDPTIYQVHAGGATRLVTLAKGEFFELPVRAGNYGFSWTGGPAKGQLTVVSVNPGEQAFVQVQFRRIMQVGDEVAAVDLKNVRPISRARVFDSAVRIPDRRPEPKTADAAASAPKTEPAEDRLASAQPVTRNEPAPTSTPIQPQAAARNDKPPLTLRSIREAYLNQSIVVRGSVVQGTMTDWSRARAERDRYRPDSRSVPANYRGQRAKVVAVQIAQSATATPNGGVNALGEPASQDDVIDPQIELVAQFSDGTLGITSARYEFLADRARLAGEHQQREAEMTKNLPLTIGKTLYATGLTTLYEPNTTIEELTGQREILKRLSAARIPLFEPLQILAARYVAEEDGVVLKLRLPGGTEALSYTNRPFLDAATPDMPFIQKISGTLLAGLPNELTPKEIEAVKQGELYRGMSSRAVSYTFGQPESESHWGNSGKERIYLKTISVRFDNKDTVVEWQMIATK